MINDPTILFSQRSKEEDTFNCDSLLKSLKDIVDPVIATNENSVLDEIYVDGLDATQVWAQVKMVFDGIEKNIWNDITDFKSEGLYNDDGQLESSDDEEISEDGELALGEMEEGSEQELEEDEIESGNEEEASGAESEEDLIEGKEVDNTEDEAESKNESDEEEIVDDTSSNNDHGLNDGFFELDDYKRQVLALEDADGLESDGEEVDLFADLDDDDDDDEMYTYDDFFDPQKGKTKGNIGQSKKVNGTKSFKKGKHADLGEEEYDAAYNLAQSDLYGEDGENEEEDEDDEERADVKEMPREERLSTFEKQQRELQREIAELEAESIAEKKWTMKGEVSGKQRDSDTLLEEELEFDRTAKPVPIITQETTETIEEIIKRRITNQEFDEVQKRIISELNNFKPSKKVQVSEEKSTKSLAELYEDEMANKNPDEQVNEELQLAHNEISELFKDVTYQLDSLYSSHFVPKPKEKLLDVRIQTSTIAMEDAQPLTMATSNTLAPQEIYKIGAKVGKDEVVLRSGVVMAKAELERDDKQRLHRARKRKQHLQSKDESIKKKKVETNQL